MRQDGLCRRGGPVGAIGFCLGGGICAQLAVSEPALGAAVVFYGAAPPAAAVARIRCPVRGFYGAEDPRIIPGLPDFDAGLSQAGVDHELRVYPDTPHAFFNDTRPSNFAVSSPNFQAVQACAHSWTVSDSNTGMNAIARSTIRSVNGILICV